MLALCGNWPEKSQNLPFKQCLGTVLRGSDNRQSGYPFRNKDGTVRIIKGCATSLR
jgi:hypothetical protein